MPRAAKPKSRKPAPAKASPWIMTQRAFALSLTPPVTASYVNKLVGQGKIKKVQGNKIDSRQAKAVILAYRRAGRVVGTARRRDSQPRGQSDTAKLTLWRARREETQARIAELELQRLNKDLLPASEVLEAERRKNTNVRASFRRLAQSLAPTLHQCRSAAEVQEKLLDAIDRELSELARDPLGMLEPPAPAPPRETIPHELPAVLPPLPTIPNLEASL